MTGELFRDRFTEGLDLGGRWQLLTFGPSFTADQGTVETTGDGLRVRSPGTNGETGEPAMEPAPPLGNHLKWVAQISGASSARFPGRDVPAQGTLAFRMQLGGRVFGADRHPFGDAVSDPGSDFRLGAAVMNVMDFETNIVFDFWVTNDAIYPIYERFRSPQPGDTALAFTATFAAVGRTVDTVHDLAICYEGATGTVTWHVDGEQVAAVSRVGHPSPDAVRVLDHGGTAKEVRLRQLLGGFGIMTLLDAGIPPTHTGLVDLGEHYVYPTTFRGGSDAFGQGVELVVRDFRIDHIASLNDLFSIDLSPIDAERIPG